jgi:hypothetical protein
MIALSTAYFISWIPDIEIEASEPTEITISTDSDGVVFRETLYPVGGVITLSDLEGLLAPYARRHLAVDVTISVSGSVAGTTKVLYSKCDVGVSAEEFYDSHFLTLLSGPKITALGRYELISCYGSSSASCTARYGDGSTGSFSVPTVGGNAGFTTFDVSPSQFAAAGKVLVGYAITAGNRRQEYEIDLSQPDCAPVLAFVNSFGVEELLYCTGTHRVDPDYKRSTTRVGRLLRNYRTDETRLFRADTGVLNRAMAAWADDLLRSDEVTVCFFVGGQFNRGKEVVITESKSENRSDDDFLPRFTFAYQYAQRTQNVLQVGREGRIFDNTFDYTFN